MKTKLLKIISTISLALVLMFSPVCVQGITSKHDSEELTVQIRTVEASSQMLDVESIFNEYDDGELKIDGTLTTFEGTKRFSLSDFEELDLVSDSEVDDEFSVKYHYGYDYETNIVTLTAILVVEEDVPLIDTLEGYAFINSEGNIDAEFDIDGEPMLLSELQEFGMIENCGWFTNLCKKVVNTVKKTVTNTVNTVKTAVNKTVESVKTATSSTLGAVITGLGAAACVAVGVIGAVVAAPAIAVVAVGAVVGSAALASATIVSTSQNNGEVDWDAVKQSAVVGAVLGGAISGISYATTSAIQSAVAKSAASTTKLSGSWQKVNESMSEASRQYQTQITGHTGEAFIQNGVKFDGVIDGNLVDAKCHYAQFVDKSTGQFYNWFEGKQSLIDEASRQISASEGAHIQWYFAEQESLNAVKALFSQDKALQVIELIFKAMI